MTPTGSRRGIVRLAAAAAVVAAWPCPLRAQAPPAPSETHWFLRNWTRIESWHFFEPSPGGGDPDYTDVANRLQVGVERHAPRIDVMGALQYVQFGGLPSDATGPGALGTGALYFDQGGGSDSHHLYLRYLTGRVDVHIGGGIQMFTGAFG